MQLSTIPIWDALPELTWKEKIALLTHRFMDVSQVPCPITHSFDEYGTYTREMLIPAQTIFLGRAHRYGHECRLVSGSLIHISPHGKQDIEAPYTLFTTPGYHMVLFAVADCIGQTVHPNRTGTRDTDWLENDIFEPADELRALGADVARRLT